MFILKDALLKIKALIATRDTWTIAVKARDKDQRLVPATSPDACQWCLVGAIDKVCDQPSTYYAVATYLNEQLRIWYPAHNFQLQHLNDEYGFTAVHVFLDGAIYNA